MKAKSSTQGVRNRSPLYAAIVVAMFGASAVSAADIAPAATGPNGLMTFPHVQVVNRPDLATAPKNSAVQQGFKAYIDPATGLLRPPNQDDVLQESAAGAQAQSLAQSQGQVDTQFVTPSGAIGMTLPESSMMFSVVQKNDDGTLNEFCVVGPEAAEKLMHFKAPASSALNRKGVRDVR